MSNQHFFLNNEYHILATSSDVDLSKTTDWKEFIIHGGIAVDKKTCLVYVRLYPLVKVDYELDIQRVYDLADFIAEKFSNNKLIFEYNGEFFTVMSKSSRGPNSTRFILPYNNK